MVSDSILFPVPTEMVTWVTSDPNCHQQCCINAPVLAPLLLLPDKFSRRFIRSECLGHRTQWDRLHWVQPVCFSEFWPRVHCRSGAHSGNWPAHQQREEWWRVCTSSSKVLPWIRQIHPQSRAGHCLLSNSIMGHVVSDWRNYGVWKWISGAKKPLWVFRSCFHS